jgi:hypothetical protein
MAHFESWPGIRGHAVEVTVVLGDQDTAVLGHGVFAMRTISDRVALPRSAAGTLSFFVVVPSSLAATQQVAVEEYKAMATMWGVERSVIDKPAINGATR